jgi:N-acetylmuramoyl-L-alanine amidase
MVTGAGRAAPVYVLQDVRYRSDHRETRVMIEVDGVAPYEISRQSQPPRLYIDLPKARLAPDWERQSLRVDDGRLEAIRVVQLQPEQVRVALDLQADGDYRIYTLLNPYRIVIELQGGRVVSSPGRKTPRTGPSAPLSAVPTTPLTIVIDPGHGGKDSGAIGPGGLMEKTVVLQIARELRQIMRQALPQARLLLTREHDTFIPLRQRAAIANAQQAHLFISIHANSSKQPQASGIETWYLSFAANARAKIMAARENQIPEAQLSDLEMILRDMQQTDRINQSAVLAGVTQASLVEHVGTQYDGIVNRGVDGAPFAVLLYTSMPSILVEVSFVSNPRDEERLRNRSYQQALARGIFRGVRQYLSQATVLASQ